MNNKATEWENVKIKKQIVERLRSHKKQTGVSITAFVEMAVLERLSAKIKSSKKQ